MLYKNKYRIESARCKNWDYSSEGAYFITICAYNRKHYFGTITDGKIIFSETGTIADKYWREIPDHFPMVELDAFVIMPNHVHGIIIIDNKTISQICVPDISNIPVNPRNAIATVGSGNTDNHGITGITGRDKALPCLYDKYDKYNKYNKYDKNTDPNTGANTASRFQNQGKGTISAIIGSYKSICTKTINKTQNAIRFAWQPRFHDHIIRNNDELIRIRQYIMNNPANWDNDNLQCQSRNLVGSILEHTTKEQ
jgi:REP element-mobilizing transposase RayT